MSSGASEFFAAGAGDVAFTGAVLVPDWHKYPWLLHGFSTRLGGTSSAYGKNDLNLGWTASDDPAAVATNRERFLSATCRSSELALLTVRQSHSNLIQHVDFLGGSMPPDGVSRLRGDGLVTRQTGLLLGIITADCVPVLLADVQQRVVGAFHAGWRGTLSRIVQRGVGDLMARYGSRAENIIAAIGPCIGKCCFAVGSEVRTAFGSQFAYGDELFAAADRGGGELRLDLFEANRRQLLDAGVPETNISACNECTACAHTESGERKYFSHRAEHGFTGRMLNVIGMIGD